jgi:SAM-dependent methyltransferase
MRWWLKAGLEWWLARIPGGLALHGQLRKRQGELANPEAGTRFDNALWILEQTRPLVDRFESLRVLELGTGWIPAIALSNMLCGARVETFDVERLVKPRLLQSCIRGIEPRLSQIAETAGVAEQVVHDRYELIAHDLDFHSVAEKLGGSYCAPADTRDLPHDDNQVDLVLSSLVLAQIPLESLDKVLGETLRVLRPGGVAIHRVHLADEYSRSDPNRSDLEFLKYSDKQWNRFFNHSLKHINRLRHAHYVERFSRLGFETLWLRKQCETPPGPQFSVERAAPEFQHLSAEELSIVSFEVALRKPMTASPTPRTQQSAEDPLEMDPSHTAGAPAHG